MQSFEKVPSRTDLIRTSYTFSVAVYQTDIQLLKNGELEIT